MADLETLTLQINTESEQAYSAIGKLAKKLDALGVSIAKLETGKLNDLANGLNNLNGVIQGMNANTSKWDYNKIVTNLSVLAATNTAGLDNLATSLTALNGALNGLNGATNIDDSLKQIISSIGKLGGKSIDRAITNLPKLEKALARLLNRIAKTPEINQSIIEFTNSLTNLASQGSKIGTATKSISRSLDSFGHSATRATRKSFNLASAIGKVYAQFWIAMRAASGLKKAFTDAADYLEAYNYFEVVAEKIGTDTFHKAGVGSADEYTDAFISEMKRKLHQMSGLELDLEDRLIKTTNAKSLGLNLTEITQYQASIASITNAMGQAQEVSTATAKAFSMLAADMGSLRNVDYEQVASNLQSALTGQARALYKYGIDLTQATLEQYAYAAGVDKAVSEMTQAEKAQLRLLAILDQSKVAWGDLANTINSPANQLRQLRTNFSELGTVLGQLFIPIMQKTLPWINGLSIALKRLLVDIASLLGIQLTLDEFGQGFSDTIDEDTESLDDLNKSMEKTKKGIREFDELKVIGGDNGKAASGLSDQIDLTKQILDATAEYERVWDEAYERMTSKASEIAGKISMALEPIREIVADFAIGDFFKAGEDVSHLVASIFNFVAEAISEVDWKDIGNKIGDFIKGIDWTSVLAGLGNLIGSALQGAINLWWGSFSVAPFETALITAFALLKFTGLGEVVRERLSSTLKKSFESSKLGKIDFQQLGLGAISIGLGVALTIDNIQSVAAGETAVSDLKYWLKTAGAALFAGAGLQMAASAIGIASGGLAFVIGASISLIATLILSAINEESPAEAARKVKEEELAWVDEYNLNALEIKTDIELRGTITKDSIDNLDHLANEVWEMSQNYENLTAAQKGWLKEYSDQLVQAVPEIKGMIDEVTGAYKGQKEELDALIEKEKEEITLNSYRQNLQDVTNSLTTGQRNLQKLKSEQSDLLAEIAELRLQSEEEQKDPFWYLGNVEDTATYKLEQKLGEYAALNGKIEATNQTIEDLTKDQKYWLDQMNSAFETSFSGTEVIIEESIDNSVKVVEKQKLPKAMSETLGKVETKIKNGEMVTKYEMNQMFNGINNSFAGLGNGKVPDEVQATMDNIEYAIITGSPKLINYMSQLKIQMEKAFADAHYDNNGEAIWNVNDISERLDKDVKNITEGVDRGAKPVLTSLENDLKELFGGEMPDEVNNALVSVADTINNGKGKTAIMDAMDSLIKVTTKKADELGMNLCWGAIGGIYTGTSQIPGAIENMVDNGMVKPYQTYTETNSPSRLFRRLATNVPEGVALGIIDDTPDVVKAMNVLVGDMQAAFAGYQLNIPSLDIGASNRNAYASGSRYTDTGNSLFEQMGRTAANGLGSAAQEVVFRVEGDPYNIFKVVREQNESFKGRTHRSAFT